MQREWSLFAAFLAVLLVAGLLAAAVPGAVDPPEEDVRRGYLQLQDVLVSHGPVGGETVPLRIEARIQHGGGPSENVTVRFRALGAESGLLEASETVTVGTIHEAREVGVEATLRVPRNGGYRIETVVYEEGQRRDEGATTVAGVGTLTPQYAQTPVDFHRFAGGENAPPSVEYRIAETGGGTTTLNVSTYLTNGGDTASEPMRLVLTARQADSNIVAAEESIRVGQIPPGTTVTPSAELTVPAEYNYYLDAVLWKDGVVVTSTRAAANLDPTETIAVNRTRREVGLRVGDFERGDGAERPEPPATKPSGAAGPGFGAVAAVVALLALGLARGGSRD
ncbi:MAG: PGF-CTERM sorting domain-containing protein [Halorientalis sp.]